MSAEHFRTPITQEQSEITNDMQRQCVDAYLTVAYTLQPGMTEKQVAEAIEGELAIRGITDYWYNVPIIAWFGDRISQMMNPQLRDPHYTQRKPQQAIALEEGMAFFIDMHPRHESGRWGNFAATGILRPTDNEEAIKILGGLAEALQAKV